LATIAGLQRLMVSEQQFMAGINPLKWHIRIFEMITRDILDMVSKEGDAITTRVRKSIVSFDLLQFLHCSIWCGI